MKNKDLIKRAIWSVADLAADGGLLSPAQSDQFINYILDAPTMLPNVRTPRMNAPSTKVNRIAFGQRLLKTAEEGVCPDSDRPETSRGLELNAKEYMARIDLPYSVIEDNIMGGNIGQRRNGGGDATGGIVDLIMRMLAQQVALDLEELALRGDTGSADPFLASQDGWLKLSQANTVDAGGSKLSGALMTQALGSLPPWFQRRRADLRYFTSTNQRLCYGTELAARQTALGDAQFTGNVPLNGPGGVRVEDVSMIPDEQSLLTMWQNLVLGFWRQINIETDKEICERVHRIVVTTRVAVGMDDPNAAVAITNMGDPNAAGNGANAFLEFPIP